MDAASVRGSFTHDLSFEIFSKRKIIFQKGKVMHTQISGDKKEKKGNKMRKKD